MLGDAAAHRTCYNLLKSTATMCLSCKAMRCLELLDTLNCLPQGKRFQPENGMMYVKVTICGSNMLQFEYSGDSPLHTGMHYSHIQNVTLPAVLARQRDWDVLKATGRFLNSIGAKEHAVTLRTALAGDKCFEDSHFMHELIHVMKEQTTQLPTNGVMVTVWVCDSMMPLGLDHAHASPQSIVITSN